MRFSCPRCQTWQSPQIEEDDDVVECTCGQCGTLLRATRLVDGAGTPRWEATALEDPAAPAVAAGSDALGAFVAEARSEPRRRRAERLTSGQAQLLALSVAAAPRLWLPAAVVIAAGLATGVLMVMVGQRVERSLALLLLAPALGVVAWCLVLSASAVANQQHTRLQGGADVGLGRSFRMILEHGSGAVASALRFVVFGVVLAVLLGVVALAGAFPGLAGPRGLAATGLLLSVQVVASAAAILGLAAMAVALLLHPGLAATGARSAPQTFQFVLAELRHRRGEVAARTAYPLGYAILLGVVGYQLLRAAFSIAFTLNQKVLGPAYADLLAASPVRFLLGAPELLDPDAALSLGGLAVALSLVVCVALLLGYLAAYLGVSGLLVAYGLELPERFKKAGR